MGRDISKLAIHNGKAPWEAEYGPDYGYIEETQERVELLAA